jgi:D-glycero-alpha-D-manno-heptose-7-phosphate kinase
MPIFRSKAPLRISFAGGGTDVSPYPEERGGAVLNCTIDKFAYVTLEVGPDRTGATEVESLDFGLKANYERPSDLVYNGELDLIKAALRVLRPYDGEAAPTDALRLFLHSDAPPGTGLGGSSAMCVALVGAFQHYLREGWTSYDVAELAYRIERTELGITGGRQDQYAAAFGGFNFIEFGRDRTIVNPLKIRSEIANELSYRLLLAYAGGGHFSNELLDRQQQGYAQRRRNTVDALDATKELAIAMKNELLRGNIDEMGRLLDEGWRLKKQFADGISNPQVDALYAKAREAGALGGKLVGAGGGGFILLMCDFARRAQVARAVQAAGGRVSEFSLEGSGVQTWAVRAEAPSSRSAARPGRVSPRADEPVSVGPSPRAGSTVR